MRALVAYWSKYGNCKLVAEAIAAGMMEAGVESIPLRVDQVDMSRVGEYDAILLGAPVWAARPVRPARKFAKNLRGAALDGKLVAIFETRGRPESGFGIKKLKELVSENAPAAKLYDPGFTAQVTSMRGPLADAAISEAGNYGRQVAAQLHS